MALSDPRPTGHTPAPMDLPLKAGLARLTHGVSPASVAGAYADWFTHLLVSPSRQADLLADADPRVRMRASCALLSVHSR